MHLRFLRQAAVVSAALGLLWTGCELDQEGLTLENQPAGPIGRHQYLTPVNQLLTAAGTQVELPGMRPLALALSPDGRLLVTAGKTHELVVLNPRKPKFREKVAMPSDYELAPSSSTDSTHNLAPDTLGQLSFTGLVFSPDGSRLYLANVRGTIKVFQVDKNTISGLFSIDLPESGVRKRRTEIPAGLAVSRDGKRLYVALNLSNRLAEYNARTGRLLRFWGVGVAPYEVVLAGPKAYVSNWGGRRPETNSLTGPAGRGTRVRVDPVRHIANEGSVSVIDLTKEPSPDEPPPALDPFADPGEGLRVLLAEKEIMVGLHACAMALSPNERWLTVANAASDTLSVIDTRTDSVIETIWTRQSPADLFGASPNALAFDGSGRRLFVCNGTQNAVAVVRFEPGQSKLLGLIPVGWFPGSIVYDKARAWLYVANIKGFPLEKEFDKGSGGVGFNSHQYHGTLSLLRVPSDAELLEHTRVALFNMRYPLLGASRLPARPGQPPRPVPERVGEPSVFKYVVYIIKENRTYDQVLGDMPEGNGDASLCIFGERISPNHHQLARQFVLLDNTYCSGILSADGHQWTDSAFATDYMERAFAGFPRSYPDGMGDDEVDALAYSPAGFIWDHAIAHGKTLRDYGEFAIVDKSWKNKGRRRKPRWRDHYREFVEGTDTIKMASRPAIASLGPYLVTNTVGWDLDVPDVFRAAQFIKELEPFERSGTFPNLTLICLPNDHTSGTKAGSPTPAAQVADNDLSLGQIVEALSRSRFWKEMCIFVIEDDPQAGWDHVSGYRTVAYVISPYTKRRQVVSTHYNQTSLLRTIELILGLPPMNQMDATATPMFDCFTDTPDFSVYRALTNNVPLDQMNPEPQSIGDPLLRKQAYASARLPLERVDQCPEDQFNRILWHAMKGSASPYPDWAARRVKGED